MPDELKEIVNDNTRLHLYSVVSKHSDGPKVFEDARDGLDVVVLKVKDGPMLVLHPANARDLLMSDDPDIEKDGAVPISSRLPWPETGNTVRGAEPASTLEWFGVIGAGQASAIGKHIALNIAKDLDKRGDAGLFKLSSDVPPAQAASAVIKEALEAPEIAPGKSLLIFLHGTLANTERSFGKLWSHPEIIDALFQEFHDGLYGFDHPTLTTSPIKNALALAKALPEKSSLTLVTHSRGGIVAEILVRAIACAPGQDDGIARFFDSKEDSADLSDLIDVRTDDDHDPDRGERLTVSIRHGDLRFVRSPLLVGHYQSLSLTGSEKVVNELLEDRMRIALHAGIYPDRVGTGQVFENGRHSGYGRKRQRFIPRPQAVIVVGLGEEGKLNAHQLSFTIRTGILALAERLAEDTERRESIEIAATLIGSGGTGITIGDAALALVRAIKDANAKLKQAKWARVTKLEIVELYLDRASDAWRVLRLHAETNAESLKVDDGLARGHGHLRRPLDSSYRGASYDFIRALQTEGIQAGGTQPTHPDIVYSLDTKRARTEVRAQRTQGSLVRSLVNKASSSHHTNPLFGRTLFKLLVPVAIEPYLVGSADMVIELDQHTAALPWELLDTDPTPGTHDLQGPPKPWAVRCRVIRKLQTRDYSPQVVDASVDDNVLIIGDPKVDDEANFGNSRARKSKRERSQTRPREHSAVRTTRSRSWQAATMHIPSSISCSRAIIASCILQATGSPGRTREWCCPVSIPTWVQIKSRQCA